MPMRRIAQGGENSKTRREIAASTVEDSSKDMINTNF